MGERYARTFESVREEVLGRLVEVRGSMDQAFAVVPDEVIRGQFDQVLGRMRAFLADGDAEKYRSFLHRWSAMRVGEGVSAENLIHSMVALGDLVVQIARRRLGQTDEAAAFSREVVRMVALAARLIVNNMAEELSRRLEQKREQEAGGRAR